jgi:NTP pyrophosphatase (non-canonical NTP hydrolase)
MTIEKHIERIKTKYSQDKDMQLQKLLALALQIGLGYGAKQLLKKEIDSLYEQGAKPTALEVCVNNKIKDSMSLKDLSYIVNDTINYIKTKYPNEQNSMDRWMTIVTEEIGEIARAIQEGDINNFVEECTQSIAAIYLMCQDFCNKNNCSVTFEEIQNSEVGN